MDTLQISFVKEGETSLLDGERGHLIINSVEYPNSHYDKGFIGKTSAKFYQEEPVRVLLNYSFAQIGKFINHFSFDLEIESWLFFIQINCNPDGYEAGPSINVSFKFEVEMWNKPYSILNLSTQLSRTIEARGNPNCTFFILDYSNLSSGFGMSFTYDDADLVLSEISDIIEREIKSIALDAIAAVINNLDHEAITTFFIFPDHIKTACKQYLIYFAQFLVDMGIEAETQISEDAYKTFFKIVPKDKTTSLEKIREILKIYLDAPQFEEVISTGDINNNIAAMQWQANIMHLKSQLALANSILQLKEATIQSLELSNYQLNKIVQENQKEANKEEDIIDGVVSVKKYDGKAFSINFAEILRRLKRKFK
jgi:hypothetical protein